MGVKEMPMEDSEPVDNQEPETPVDQSAEDTTPPPQQIADNAPNRNDPSMAANPAPMADNSDIGPPASAASPVQQAPAPVPPSPTTAQEYDQHDAQYANDLATKQIKPQTSNSLYANKDTLGKIGTFFGLLLAGAGSGLTHQPNVILDMMNKEIDRDLEAQKQNVANKQNYLGMSYNHELQMAQQKRMEYENQLAQAQIGAIPTDIRYKTAQANALDANNAGLASYNRAKNNALTGAFQHLVDTNANNPQAQAILANTIAPAIKQQQMQNNQQAAAKQQLNTAQYNQRNPQAQNSDQPVDTNRMQQLINLGKIAPEMPGAIAPQDVGQVTREAQEVQENRNFAKIYDDSFKKLDSMAAAGAINKNARAAQVATLGAALARSTTGRYNAAEALTQADGMFPSVVDWGGARHEKFRKAMQYFQGNEAATPTLDRYGLKSTFPQYTFDNGSQKKASSSVASDPSIKSMNGKQYRKVSGGWIPVESNSAIVGQ